MSKTGLCVNLFLQETEGLLLDGMLQIFRYSIFDSNGLNFQKHFLVPISKAVNGKEMLPRRNLGNSVENWVKFFQINFPKYTCINYLMRMSWDVTKRTIM